MKIRIRKEILLSMMEVMAKKDIRTYLNGICFMPDGKVVATDGHRILIAQDDLKNKIKKNVIIGVGKLPTTRFNIAIIDTDIGIISLMPDSEISDDDAVISCRVGVASCVVVDGVYPGIDRVMPKGDPIPIDRISFNTEYLGTMAKIGKFIHPSFKQVVLIFYGVNSAAMAEISTPYGKLKYIVMPVRIHF